MSELGCLEEAGVLRKVEYSEWAVPIGPVPKKDGSLRLCRDYKVTVNLALNVDQYPLPKPSDLLSSLAGGQRFSKLHLTTAYQQVPLDEISAKLTTINTHQGLYEYTRLPFGVASAPVVFQRIMDTMLQGMPSVICHLDNILITGRNEAKHLRNLEKVLHWLQEHGVRLHKEKCLCFQESVEYLGHCVDSRGIHTSEKKVKAILVAPSPHNLQQLRSFLGLLNYYAKFLPHLASLLHPLHMLLRTKQLWHWSKACEQAFQRAKKRLVEAPVLVHYDPELPIVLAADASAYEIGAVISHKFPDGLERPVAFASGMLSASEKNYAQVEKAVVSLIFGVCKFHQYLYGRKFTLVTDHKPLTSILGAKQGIPPLAAARMQRWALLLSAYSYDICFHLTTAHGNADGLSRLPVVTTSQLGNPTEPSLFNIAQIDALPIKVSEVELATRTDPILSKVLTCLRHGWPSRVQEALMPFWRRKNELTVEGECIMWGMTVVIPSKWRDKVLDELHKGHPVVVRMKILAHSHIWWPNLDSTIERRAKACTACQCNKHLPPKAPLYYCTWPPALWDRIHIDFAGPFMGKTLFIVVDAHSKWPEVCIMTSTTTTRTNSVLREMFARFGLPKELVSDNGPQFTSDEFEQFLVGNGVNHIRSSLYHPSTNGVAEHLVQMVKQALR